MVGQKAPDFTLKSLGGSEVSLSQFEGKKIVLLGFWEAQHPLSRAVMPVLAELDAEYRDRGLKVISINRREPRAVVAKFVRESKYEPLVALDEDGSVTKKYSITTVPTLVLVDKNGRIRSVEQGFNPMMLDKLEDEICKLLGVKRRVRMMMTGREAANERNRD